MNHTANHKPNTPVSAVRQITTYNSYQRVINTFELKHIKYFLYNRREGKKRIKGRKEMKWKKGNCNHVDIYSSYAIIIPNTDRDLDTNRMQHNATEEMTSVAQIKKNEPTTTKRMHRREKSTQWTLDSMNIANYAG